MAAACKLDYLPSSRRELKMTKEDVQVNKPYESRKRLKSSAFSKQVKAGSISDRSINLPVDTKCNGEAQEEAGCSLNSNHSSSPSFSLPGNELLSQGEQPENYGKRKKRDEAFATVDHHDEESDFSEEDDGISIEELQETTGWKLLMENLDKHFERKNSDNQ